MKVGIRFSDNDFSVHCVRVFVELFIVPTFVDRGEGHMVTHLTSPMIVELFNTHCAYVDRYMHWESHSDWYPNADTLQDIPLNKNWLTITEQEVYWDDRTDDYIGPWDTNNNSEFIWTDGIKVYIS